MVVLVNGHTDKLVLHESYEFSVPKDRHAVCDAVVSHTAEWMTCATDHEQRLLLPRCLNASLNQ